MRNIVCGFFALFLLQGCASTPTEPSGACLADNLRPEYGRMPFCQRQLDANKTFLEAVDQKSKDRFHAAMSLTNGGLSLASTGDYDTAIRRFNQAWLADADAFGPYFGFALVLLLRDEDRPAALDYFAKAERLVPEADLPRMNFIRGQIECLAGNPEDGMAFMLVTADTRQGSDPLYQKQIALCRNGSSLDFLNF